MVWTKTAPFPRQTAQARLKRLRRLAWLIDGAFGLPGTGFRFGLNSIIGLLPVGGDVALGALSLYIVSKPRGLEFRGLFLRGCSETLFWKSPAEACPYSAIYSTWL